MKRANTTSENSISINNKSNLSVEGVVVAISNMTHKQNQRTTSFWTALLCQSDQNIIRITKYLSCKRKCALHEKLVEFYNKQDACQLNKLKFNTDDSYTATTETTVVAKQTSIKPTCLEVIPLDQIESKCDGEYGSFLAKILEIGSDESVVFNNAKKRVLKLKRAILVADKTSSICMNIWQDQFDLIKQNSSYKIKLAKVKLFNNELSITTISSTTFEEINDIGNVQSSEIVELDHDINITGNIVSIGLIEQKPICSKCFSKEVETTEKSVKCKQCKTRYITKNDVQDNRLKLTMNTPDDEPVELIIEKEKIKELLEQSNYDYLSQQDPLENESVLLTLSSINLSITYNSKNKNIINIATYDTRS
ncbi:unnamed protein product [Adineta ricciae]|uniref:Uncharacterized protein n=1 Tax=Adineta ricciae TaxID=249248 RepID=A0A815V1P2_ADIRI|nr:unnamed protein product [Adineta ricciae]CAF1565515.1 unnamed protein product [Adineta ricciae]